MVPFKDMSACSLHYITQFLFLSLNSQNNPRMMDNGNKLIKNFHLLLYNFSLNDVLHKFFDERLQDENKFL